MNFLTSRIIEPLKKKFTKQTRNYRMQAFIGHLGIQNGERVLDLGGVPEFWENCPIPLDITILNLPGYNPQTVPQSHHRITLVEGDACNVEFATDNSFDIVFSNSVIEHVGDEAKRSDMAREVRRLAPRYWVQTPSIWFPMEAHCHMFFWWFYPESVRRFFMNRWRRSLPAWTNMMLGTTVVLRGEMLALFPDAAIWTERKFGFTKSYIAFRSSTP
ncbi:methyltransferase domain-containing protein [Roseibium sp.]|uniref:class I SAM-dependent methyltransferase n=1 Tax=Roseibium sp. TaxID=1936156 RepID=UPI00391A64E7